MAKKRVHDDEEDGDGGIEDENCENASEEMEEEDHDEDRARRKRSKKKKKKNPGLMSASGQTEQDRRILRRKQRELHQDIAIGNGSGGTAADGGGDDGEELARLRDQNNELWGEVRYTREAVLDGENIDLLAGKAARQAEKIVQVSLVVWWGMLFSYNLYGIFFLA